MPLIDPDEVEKSAAKDFFPDATKEEVTMSDGGVTIKTSVDNLLKF